MNFGQKLESICKDNNTTLNNLCVKAFIKDKQKDCWFRGAIPSKETLAKISDYLNLPISDLLQGVEILNLPTSTKAFVKTELEDFEQITFEEKQVFLYHLNFLPNQPVANIFLKELNDIKVEFL